MKDLVPVSPSDSGLQLISPMEGGPAAPPPAKFRLQKLLFALRRFWWIPIVSFAVCFGVAVIVFLRSTPIFVSTGSLWEAEKIQVNGVASFAVDRENYLGTQAELLRSGRLRELTLNWIRANSSTNAIVLGEDGEPLSVDIQVFYSTRSSVYTIQARSANPAFTPLFLNALMKQYVEYRRNVRKELSVETLAQISEQVQKLERDLKTDQSALDDYERSNNFAILQQESAVEASYLAKLRTELSDYQFQLKLLDDALQSLATTSANATNSQLSLLESIRGSEASAASGRLEAARQVELLKADRARLSKNLRPEHPRIVKLDQDIERNQKLVDLYSRQLSDQINASRSSIEIKINNAKAFIKQREEIVSDFNNRLNAVNGLKSSIARNQAKVDSLRSMLDNVEIGRNIDQETLAILEPASPCKRSYTEGKRMIAQSGFMGLALGLGIIFLLALRDDRFNSVVEVTESFGDNVVGQVPEIPGLETAAPGSLALLQNHDDRHMFAESYRNLRSALLYLTVDGQRPRVLLVTSAVPNEGKSTVATNLARAMAMGGSKVLLIDADLRKGHIHEKLGLKSRPGFSELLRQAAEGTLADGADLGFIQPTDIDKVSFLARGAVCSNPGDWFLLPVFDEFIQRMRARFDYVILDGSPVFAADDSATLAPKVDGTLFVVRSRFSNARVVRDALNLLFQRQARVLGLVLNRANASGRSYYAYKYAEYYARPAAEAEENS